MAAPEWMPCQLRLVLKEEKELKYSFSFSRAEKKVMRKQKSVRVSKWAEQNRVVTMSSLPGPWKNSVTPYLAGIMDAAGLSHVRIVTICKAPQTGVSEAAHNFVGHQIDRDPGPVMYIYPDEQTARENSRDRILPMIKSSAKLRTYLRKSEDDAATMRINLEHMPIYLAWASSAARLGNKPIKDAIADEKDKYPMTAGKREASPTALIAKRLITYKNISTLWNISTPTFEDGPITVDFNEAQVRFDFWVVCPGCGERILMDFDQIRWPEDERDPKKIEAGELAWYECQACEEKWSDAKRDMAVRMGQWQDRASGLELFACLEKYKTKDIAFHVPSWLSHFVSLSTIAAAFIKTLKKYYPGTWRISQRDFFNQHKATFYTEITAETSIDRLMELNDDRPRGLVPGGGVAAALLATVDTQDNGFWYRIRAWGWGETAESWGVIEGFVMTFEALERILWENTYKDANGKQYTVHFALIDAMGHRTKEVYEWCKKHPGKILPLQGVDRQNAPVTYSNLTNYPGTKKSIPGGITLVRVKSNYYKDSLASRLEVSPNDPGAYHMHKDTTIEWTRMLTSEYVTEKGSWECRPGWDNHGWDLEYYQVALHDICEIAQWSQKAPKYDLEENDIKQELKKKQKRRQRW
jgi:phage terminase large subunit GpA-like protein